MLQCRCANDSDALESASDGASEEGSWANGEDNVALADTVWMQGWQHAFGMMAEDAGATGGTEDEWRQEGMRQRKMCLELEAFANASRRSGPLFLVVAANWCGACQQLKQNVRWNDPSTPGTFSYHERRGAKALCFTEGREATTKFIAGINITAFPTIFKFQRSVGSNGGGEWTKSSKHRTEFLRAFE